MKKNRENPVFIIGVPRSGTTMLWDIMIKLDEFKGSKILSWNTETSIFKKYVKHMNYFFEPNVWPFWNEYFVGDYDYFEKFLIDSCRSFLINAANAREAKRILEKTPNHIEHLEFIVKVFPKSCFVHIFRHPVDVYASMRKRAIITDPTKDPWLRASIQEFAESYNRKIFLAINSPHKIIHVKYEDLTKNPELVMKKICEFIKTPYSNTCLKGKIPIKKNQIFPLQSNVPIPNSNNWQKYLKLEEIIELENSCQQSMKVLKYDKYEERGEV